VTRSTDYRSGFYLQNKPPEGEEYFLTEVPDQLVEHEICGWTVDSNTDLSSLKDIY
jgi:hypothetical protein